MDWSRLLTGITMPWTEIPGVRQGMGDFWDQLRGQGKYDPTNKAMPWLEQAKQQYMPYQQQGQEAYGKLNPILSQMGQDPGAYLESLMKGYEPSKAYQSKFNAMSQAAGNTAAAGGLRGGLADIQQQAGIADKLMGEDMQQWLQNVLGIQQTGLGGLGDFYNKGYGATSDIANILGSQGGLAFQGQSQQNKSFQDLIKSLMEAMAKGASAAATGGAGGM